MAVACSFMRAASSRVTASSRAAASAPLAMTATHSRRVSGAAAGSSGTGNRNGDRSSDSTCSCARTRMRGRVAFTSRARRGRGGFEGAVVGRDVCAGARYFDPRPFVSTEAVPSHNEAASRDDDAERPSPAEVADDVDDEDDFDEADEGPIVFMDELREHLRTQGFATDDDPERADAADDADDADDADAKDEYVADDLAAHTAQRVPVHGVHEDYFLDLSETSPLPDDDPPGHRAGYVCILGPPNAGKSTLMNALVGSKLAIVTSKPQTTRHQILGILSRDEYQMILMDTPGIMRDQRHKLDKRMMGSVRHARGDAEVMLGIFDVGRSPIRMYQSLGINPGKLPYAIILNKSDTLRNKGDLDAVKRWFEENTPALKVFVISAQLGTGVEEVCDWAASQLPLGPSLYPKEQLSEHPERFFVTEILREKIFLNYGQEIPYCSQVNVVEYIERNGIRKDGTRMKDYVAIDIVVETIGQKKIVVGTKGSEIKKVALAARKDIEKFLDREVYLDIKVKSRKGWRNDESFLNEYGYNLKTDS